MGRIKDEGALPPWKVFLMVNLAHDSARAGKVQVHRYPDCVAFFQNVLNPPETNAWVVVLCAGSFAREAAAHAFADLWFRGTRHTGRLLDKGVAIVRNHPATLHALVTALEADAHRARLARQHPGAPVAPVGLARYAFSVPKPPPSAVATRQPLLAPPLARPPTTLRALLQRASLYDFERAWLGPRVVAHLPADLR